MNEIKNHFDKIAAEYNFWKEKNKYYYQQLKNVLVELISNPHEKIILEMGCGTGDLLNFLNPKKGIGIDVSEGMIEIAKKTHPENEFFCCPAEDFKHEKIFDYLLFIDVIEHTAKLNEMFRNFNNLMNNNTRLIIIMANPYWEPLLMLMEKLNLKMPEGPHYRPKLHEIKKLLENNNLFLEKHLFRQLVPKNIGVISEYVNNNFHKIPLLRNLGLTEILLVRKK